MMEIYLDGRVSSADQSLIVRYVREPRTLSKPDWKTVLATFDLLGSCRVVLAGRSRTFAQFYQEAFDRPYANILLAALQATPNPTLDGQRLAAQYGKQAWAVLGIPEMLEPQTLEQKLLVAYCLYWWNSFAKGYTAEIAVFRDLADSGIRFQAHDLTRPDGRYSPEDLLVSGMRGDIKSSTYFLESSRNLPLRHDFYLTMAFDELKRQSRRIVILQPAAWARIDGETQTASWEEAMALFPKPVEVTIQQQRMVVVDYEVWKETIRIFQQ